MANIDNIPSSRTEGEMLQDRMMSNGGATVHPLERTQQNDVEVITQTDTQSVSQSNYQTNSIQSMEIPITTDHEDPSRRGFTTNDKLLRSDRVASDDAGQAIFPTTGAYFTYKSGAKIPASALDQYKDTTDPMAGLKVSEALKSDTVRYNLSGDPFGDSVNASSPLLEPWGSVDPTANTNNPYSYNDRLNGAGAAPGGAAGTRAKADPTGVGIGWGHSDVLNPPFQFGKLDDVRYDSDSIGRYYLHHIQANIPKVFFEIGEMRYANNLFEILARATGNNAIDPTVGDGVGPSAFISGIADFVGGLGAILGGLIGHTEYIWFDPCKTKFKNYVNDIWLNMATMLGITANGNYLGGSSKGALDLTSVLSGRDVNFVIQNKDAFIPFMIQSDVNVSETFSNNTGEHPLAGELNSMSKEAQENKQGGGLSGMTEIGKSGNLMKSIGDFMGKQAGMFVANQLSSSGILKGEAAAIAMGNSRVRLPEVWDNSSYSKSYSLTFDFYSPYGSIQSIFENVYAPVGVLLAMALPRQVSQNSYTQPFFVRVFSPGLFNIPFGVVESISITRGEDKNDRIEGRPIFRRMKVSMSIKDLNPNLVMSRSGLLSAGIKKNESFFNYMMSLCGLSLGERMNLQNIFGRMGFSMSQWGTRLNNTFDGLTLASWMGSFGLVNSTVITGNMVGGTPFSVGENPKVEVY